MNYVIKLSGANFLTLYASRLVCLNMCSNLPVFILIRNRTLIQKLHDEPLQAMQVYFTIIPSFLLKP